MRTSTSPETSSCLGAPNGWRVSRLADCASIGSLYILFHRRKTQRRHQAEGQVGLTRWLGGVYSHLYTSITLLLLLSLHSITSKNGLRRNPFLSTRTFFPDMNSVINIILFIILISLNLSSS
jgi:hypothetical protein